MKWEVLSRFHKNQIMRGFMKDIAHHLKHQQRKILRDARQEKAARLAEMSPEFEEESERKLNPKRRKLGKRDWK